MLQRRSLLAGLGLVLAAPAIIRTPGLLMPVRRPLAAGGGMHISAVDGAFQVFDAQGNLVFSLAGSGTFVVPGGTASIRFTPMLGGGAALTA